MIRLVRRKPAAGNESAWDPDAGQIDARVLDGVDVAVNLCGVGIANRPLTAGRKETVRSSRVNPTRTLAGALIERLKSTGSAPALVQSSATGFYPTQRADRPMTEVDHAGESWIAGLVTEWEDAARPAAAAGVRVVWMRTSPVIDSSGGVFPWMKRAWSLGAGAMFGDGSQHMPLVQLDDYLRFVVWAAGNPEASGPYNLTLPSPTTNGEFSDELARQLHRPRLFKLPKVVLDTALGDLAEQLLGDAWLLPQRALDEGFVFESPDLPSAIRAALRG